jgi:hypothetical protein
MRCGTGHIRTRPELGRRRAGASPLSATVSGGHGGHRHASAVAPAGSGGRGSAALQGAHVVAEGPARRAVPVYRPCHHALDGAYRAVCRGDQGRRQVAAAGAGLSGQARGLFVVRDADGDALDGQAVVQAPAIYARVSSARQKEQQTIARRSRRCTRTPSSWGLTFRRSGCSAMTGTPVPVCCDRLWRSCVTWSLKSRSRWCWSTPPDRLARKYAYQAVLIEEFAKAGSRWCS